MSQVPREAVEQRAYTIWHEAGCPEGSSLAHWLQAERELGILPSGTGADPFVTLQEMAQEARQGDEARLARSFDEAVPPDERLPGASDDNPLSRQVRAAGKERTPRHGASTLEGGNEVPS